VKVKLHAESVRARYTALASRFALRLEW
jgi:hypothetical protein